MAISINWATQVINVPKTDTQLVQSSPTEIRELDIDSFRLDLKDLEDDEEGIPFLDTHSHNPPVTVGGVTLARVVEIINGYTVTFEDGAYAVNLVGANSNIADVTNVNQVSVRSANSAGLTYSKQVEDISFEDARVWIDTNNGLSGTQYPRGTVSDPVNNLSDAQTIISVRSLPKRIHLTGSISVSGSDDISGYNIRGDSPELGSLTVAVNAVTTDLVLDSISITGDLNGDVTANSAVSFANIIDFDGKLIGCGLNGTITLGTGGGVTHEFIDCYSEMAGDNHPIIDCSDLSGLEVQFRRYSGGLEITNFSQSDAKMSIDLTAGSVTLASSCTDGEIVVRGVGNIVDNSGAGCTVLTDGLIQPDTQAARLMLVEKLLRNKFITDPSTGIATLYDDDGSTVLFSGQLYQDAAGTQTYQGQGAERRERLT